MSDIDVTFGAPGAANAARDADRFAASTTKGSIAAQKNVGATKAQAAGLRESTIAARAATVAQGHLSAATEEATRKQIKWGAGAKLAGVGRAFKGAGFLGSLGETMGVSGGGVAGMIAAVAAFELLTHALNSEISELKSAAEATAQFAEAIKSAKKTQEESGAKGASEFGPILRQLIARGGGMTSLASNFSSRGYGMKDAGQAVMNAQDMFPQSFREALEEANDAARVTGETLTQSIDKMRGMPASAFNVPGLAGSSAVGQRLGHAISMSDYFGMAERQEGNKTIGHLDKFDRAKAGLDFQNIKDIPHGVAGANASLVDAQNPMLAEMRKIAENTAKAAAVAEASKGTMERFLEYWVTGNSHQEAFGTTFTRTMTESIGIMAPSGGNP